MSEKRMSIYDKVKADFERENAKTGFFYNVFKRIRQKRLVKDSLKLIKDEAEFLNVSHVKYDSICNIYREGSGYYGQDRIKAASLQDGLYMTGTVSKSLYNSRRRYQLLAIYDYNAHKSLVISRNSGPFGFGKTSFREDPIDVGSSSEICKKEAEKLSKRTLFDRIRSAFIFEEYDATDISRKLRQKRLVNELVDLMENAKFSGKVFSGSQGAYLPDEKLYIEHLAYSNSRQLMVYGFKDSQLLITRKNGPLGFGKTTYREGPVGDRTDIYKDRAETLQKQKSGHLTIFSS